MTCPHPDWALVATYDGHRRVERCDECQTITHRDTPSTLIAEGLSRLTTCGCRYELESDELGVYTVSHMCGRHRLAASGASGAVRGVRYFLDRHTR